MRCKSHHQPANIIGTLPVWNAGATAIQLPSGTESSWLMCLVAAEHGAYTLNVV